MDAIFAFIVVKILVESQNNYLTWSEMDKSISFLRTFSSKVSLKITISRGVRWMSFNSKRYQGEVLSQNNYLTWSEMD